MNVVNVEHVSTDGWGQTHAFTVFGITYLMSMSHGVVQVVDISYIEDSFLLWYNSRMNSTRFVTDVCANKVITSAMRMSFTFVHK